MKIHVLTLFPDFFGPFKAHSIVKRAIEKGLVDVTAHNLRDYTHDKHKTCDDRPFGGGPGMLMKPEPIFECVDKVFSAKKRGGLKGKRKWPETTRFIFLSPAGKKLDQKMAKSLAAAKELVFLCGHYEGVDERVIDELVTDEISIGDYVLTGGELPAMVVMDAVIRLIPGAVGCGESTEFESFSGNLLEYPQYTRPAVYRGLGVPPVLLSGNHKQIEEWRNKEAHQRTLKRRPDLLKKRSK